MYLGLFDIGLLYRYIGAGFRNGGAKGGYIFRRGILSSHRLVKLDLVVTVIQYDQGVTGIDMLVIHEVDLRDISRYTGNDRADVPIHLGVIGLFMRLKENIFLHRKGYSTHQHEAQDDRKYQFARFLLSVILFHIKMQFAIICFY